MSSPPSLPSPFSPLPLPNPPLPPLLSPPLSSFPFPPSPSSPLPCPLPPLQLLGQLRRFATTTTQWETAMESAAFSNPVEALADKMPVTRSTFHWCLI